MISFTYLQNKYERKEDREFILGLLYKDFNVFEQYGIDKYLTSISLAVIPKYRGRGISEHLLETRETVCKEFGLKLTSTLFTSDHSIRSAEKAGFQIERIHR